MRIEEEIRRVMMMIRGGEIRGVMKMSRGGRGRS